MAEQQQQPYFTIRSRRPTDTRYTNGGPSDLRSRSATHDISRTAFHVKHIGQFARRLEDSAARAFPNRGRTSQRYKNVQALLLHWASDDLFVLPELEDLEKCLRDHYGFGTDIFAIPSENSHLELMMRIGQLLQGSESQDTLFILYYGGHARIDESRQSTWCANRDPDSPWLQWSAIQTLLERSRSDVLILLDCCAGAASATFPAGDSITETISASSWNAIAPDPGRYSFTNALIEILQEWQMRAFSAAMLHAELLARLKHPRPVAINGKLFEARSTPVHFMMTSNHRAPSIELSRMAPKEPPIAAPKGKRPPVPPRLTGFVPGAGREAGAIVRQQEAAAAAAAPDPLSPHAEGSGPLFTEPTEDVPHVMISLALEDDQRLDINAWEQWLNAFPALAKYVKIQGVFKSHSTLMLVSLPIMIWDMLPEDPATSFVAFIRSNNLASPSSQSEPRAEALTTTTTTTTATTIVPQARQAETALPDTVSLTSGFSGSTLAATEASGRSQQRRSASHHHHLPLPASPPPHMRSLLPATMLAKLPGSALAPSASHTISRQVIFNKQQSQRRTTFGPDAPPPKNFAAHVEKRLEKYFHLQPAPNDSESAFIASNLGIEPLHLEIWFHHRREKEAAAGGPSGASEIPGPDALGILPSDLDHLLEISPPCHTMILDTRRPEAFDAAHVRDAINIRAPLSFLRSATIEMVEQSLADEQSRSVFAGWREAKCIVIYSDDPTKSAHQHGLASILWQGLLEHGWTGKIFVLRSSAEEVFCSLSPHHVAVVEEGIRPTADPSPRGTLDRTSAVVAEHADKFSKFLDHLETNAPPPPPPPAQERHHEPTAPPHDEQALELEFQIRCPHLHRMAQEAAAAAANEKSHGDTDLKAQLIESLDRGLTKLRGGIHDLPFDPFSNATAPYGFQPRNDDPGTAPYGTKWASASDPERLASKSVDEIEEYVEVDKMRVESDGSSASAVGSASSQGAGSPKLGAREGRRGFTLLDKMLRRS